MSDLTPAPGGYPIKLVRDRTAAIINASGEPGDLFYGAVAEVERVGWLRKKLVEEVGEYLVEPGVRELADVLEVVRALAEAEGVDLPELDRICGEDERGGFSDGVVMYGRHPEYDGELARPERPARGPTLALKCPRCGGRDHYYEVREQPCTTCGATIWPSEWIAP